MVQLLSSQIRQHPPKLLTPPISLLAPKSTTSSLIFTILHTYYNLGICHCLSTSSNTSLHPPKPIQSFVRNNIIDCSDTRIATTIAQAVSRMKMANSVQGVFDPTTPRSMFVVSFYQYNQTFRVGISLASIFYHPMHHNAVYDSFVQ